MNISSINKEKLCIMQRSKALSSMLYPDVYTGKTPKYSTKKCDLTGAGDSFDSGTYLCHPSEQGAGFGEVRRGGGGDVSRKKNVIMKWNQAVQLQRLHKGGVEGRVLRKQ